MLTKMKINSKLLPMKGHFFLFNAGTAPLVPYLSTYARQLGFTSATVGLIYTVLPICGLVVKPLFGAIADRYKVQKLLFILFQIVTAVSFLGIYFVPESTNSVDVHLSCQQTTPVLRTCYQHQDLIDGCKIKRLHNDTAFTMCNITCDKSSPNLLKLLCHKWNLPQFCGNSTESFKFSRDIGNADNDCYSLSSDKTGRDGMKICEENVRSNEFSDSFVISGLVDHSSINVENECVSLNFHNLQLPDGSVHSPTCQSTPNKSDHEMPSCFISCNSSEIQEMFRDASESMSDNTDQYSIQFAVFFLLMIISWIGQAVVVSIADAICFNLLGNKPSRYGRQRLWGSVGWGIFSLLTGVLIDLFSEGAYKEYAVAFILMFIFLSLDVVASCFIKNEATNTSPSILADVGSLLTSIHTFVFVLWTIAVGLSTGLLWQFLFWHLEDISRLSCEGPNYIKTLQGLVSAIQSFCGEIPFMFLSGAILKKLGHIHMMTLVLFAFGIRFILYSFLTNPWWVLPIEMLQGVTFGMFYPTMTSYASVIALPGTETTVQGLIGAVFEGVGTSLGSFIAGRLYDIHGGWITFRWFGYGSLICCAVHVVIQYFIQKRRSSDDAHEGLPTEEKDL